MTSAANSYLVARNFAWRVAAVSPSDATFADGFVELKRWDPERAPDKPRRFTIHWLGSDEDHTDEAEFSDQLSARPAVHRFRVDVYYPGKADDTTLHDVMLSDRHDLTKALRNPTTWVGYDDDNASASIGLYSRTREEDSVEPEDEYVYWTYSATWRCVIYEPEV